MSKAFNKEFEDLPEPPVRPARPQGPRRPITPEGFETIRAQLSTLEAEATADGPIDPRLADLRVLFNSVEVIDPPSSVHEVQFATWVLVEDEEGGRVRWRIVGPDEADARLHRLSVESPLARALLGRRPGEEVQFERPRGEVTYRIVAVAGDEAQLTH